VTDRFLSAGLLRQLAWIAYASGVIAAIGTYVGYPIWAFRLGRHLLHLAGGPVSSPTSSAPEGLTLR